MQPDRTAIVTGAGKRVGRAIAAALIEDGWHVVAHVHRESDPVPDGATRVAANLERLRLDCLPDSQPYLIAPRRHRQPLLDVVPQLVSSRARQGRA